MFRVQSSIRLLKQFELRMSGLHFKQMFEKGGYGCKLMKVLICVMRSGVALYEGLAGCMFLAFSH